MNNKEQDNYSNATLDLIKKFVDSNQRKRINLLTKIESEVENIFNLGPSLFDIFDNDGDDWAAGWILQVLKKFKPEFFENCLLYTSPSPRDLYRSRMPSSA